MKKIPALQLVLSAGIIVIHTAFYPSLLPAVIKGKVIVEGTAAPVANAYLYILPGEEETVTANDGTFVLKTWQKLPARCTVEHTSYARQTVLIRQAGTITVQLQLK